MNLHIHIVLSDSMRSKRNILASPREREDISWEGQDMDPAYDKLNYCPQYSLKELCAVE